jgi:hypothetical protein
MPVSIRGATDFGMLYRHMHFFLPNWILHTPG